MKLRNLFCKHNFVRLCSWITELPKAASRFKKSDDHIYHEYLECSKCKKGNHYQITFPSWAQENNDVCPVCKRKTIQYRYIRPESGSVYYGQGDGIHMIACLECRNSRHD